jgi:3-oxoadipate enol-lactonase
LEVTTANTYPGNHMPKITVGEFDINYKILGKGEPLLLIIGLSFSLLDWGTKFPELLAQQYQVILFDNRDAGETNQAVNPYTIIDMAKDTAGLLDKLNIAKAHVLGVSMGGMIAQHLALNHSNKLNKLILGCTMAGGSCSEFGSFNDALNGDMLDLLFPSDFIQANQAQLSAFFQTTTPYHSSGDGLARQFHAMNAHDTCAVLDRIKAPTLVITGDRDRAIPPQNSRLLAEKLPDATLEIINDAGHAFCFSHPDIAATAMLNFLNR